MLTYKSILRKFVETALCAFLLVLSVSVKGQTPQELSQDEELVTLAVENMT